MALKQIRARVQGDVYQGLFFWRQAVGLLEEESKVERVELEHDEATGVDDVAVFYEDPGVDDGRRMCQADYFQVKYHVDNRDCYSADAMINPEFIGAKTSLLQRFYKAYRKLVSTRPNFRLHLVSNWRWKEGDKLARAIRERSRELPERFFTDGPRSDLGEIRDTWRNHLELDAEEFEKFARTLRFGLNHFGRRGFKESVRDKLRVAGLKVPPADRAACPYESLIQKFLMDGPNSFDRQSFREMCEREELFGEGHQGAESDVAQEEVQHSSSLGIRSFIRFAERLDDEVDELICVSGEFTGRKPRNDASWDRAAKALLDFLADPDRRNRLRREQYGVALECHGSLSLLAGYEMSRNSGAQAFPIQKPSGELWSPTAGGTGKTATWKKEVHQFEQTSDELAIGLSVTHDIEKDVLDYLESSQGPSIAKLMLLHPVDGPGAESIDGADHAYSLASDFAKKIKEFRHQYDTKIHLFFACPNALIFFIGQLREGLGRLTAYEYGFGVGQGSTYQPSLSLPMEVNSSQPLGEMT